MVELKGDYLVRRSFTASGVLIRKGAVVKDPVWKNAAALLESGYVLPVPVLPVAVAAPAKASEAKAPEAKQSKVSEAKQPKAPEAKAPKEE